ncbi:MAG: Tryptophan synthase alpha chain [Thermomicrobiales bacterium]|nr:Tryptophan synthase alpha chain [Thermomicrobiales bacterium]
MDNANFDAVARAVAAGASRRQVLRLLAIGAVAGWLPGRARAAPARQDCAAQGLTDCGGFCADLSSDAFNCGGCGIVCDSGVCEGGACPQVSLGCVAPLVECGGLCADLSVDPFNCGGCGIVCDGGVCEGGVCPQISLGCVLPTVDCGGACVDVSADPFNCGACGNVCEGVCEGGVCAPVQVSLGCVAPLVECPGLCADLSSDPNNCGGCGVVCESEVCEGGVCASVHVDIGCVLPTVMCGGLCADLSNDPNNCGACGIVCEGLCEGGTCSLAQVSLGCVSPLVECPGLCADLSSDPNNCGACSVVCQSGTCASGVCAESTAPPATPAATSTTTPATPAAPTPTGTPPPDEAAGGEGGASTRPDRPRRDRGSRGQGAGSGSNASGSGSGSAKKAKQAKQAKQGKDKKEKGSETALAWPFDPVAGQWTIVNGYRGEGEHALPTDGGQNYAVFAFDLAVCQAESVDVADGTCALGPAAESGADAGKPGWDGGATRGADVLSPVTGTVAWTEEANATCPRIGIDIEGHPGYRLALFNVAGVPEPGQSVKQGKKIGKVAKEGCEESDRLHMVLYQPQAGVADDPEEGRKGVPFAGDWAIADCDYPDDQRTENQYRGMLVPCTPEDATPASS